ncbi:MAG TPA: serine/threonine-protein kinase [Planctomycetota bacterium]|nr:serine/threonine-protein kinase [Planctomycetota bacterium]
MLSDLERRLAILAVENGYLTGGQLSQCFALLGSSPGSLEALLCDRGYLTPEEIFELRSRVDRIPSPEPLFAEIVRAQGFATEAQVAEAFQVKCQLAAQNVHRYVGEILVDRQVLSPSQVTQVLARQGKVSLRCQACGYRFNARHGAGYVCPECGREIGSTPPSLSREGYVGGYRLEEMVGRGPSGSVYRAVHDRTHRTVALKRILASSLSRPLRDGFLFQARRMMSVRHPNVVATIESAVHGEEIIIVTDLVEGISLHDHVLGNVRLPLDEAIPILKQVAAGLSGALGRGIVHGNLKPPNVLVTEMREIRLTDFGLAQGDSGEMIHYAAPERSRHGATPPGDLYACGILWYFMLSGAPPHAGGSPDEIRLARASFTAAPLSSRVGELPPGVDAIFAKLTYKEPTLRYRTPAALIADLDLLELGKVTQAERELGRK